jgi:hypothetical protein
LLLLLLLLLLDLDLDLVGPLWIEFVAIFLPRDS